MKTGHSHAVARQGWGGDPETLPHGSLPYTEDVELLCRVPGNTTEVVKQLNER